MSNHRGRRLPNCRWNREAETDAQASESAALASRCPERRPHRIIHAPPRTRSASEGVRGSLPSLALRVGIHSASPSSPEHEYPGYQNRRITHPASQRYREIGGSQALSASVSRRHRNGSAPRRPIQLHAAHRRSDLPRFRLAPFRARGSIAVVRASAGRPCIWLARRQRGYAERETPVNKSSQTPALGYEGGESKRPNGPRFPARTGPIGRNLAPLGFLRLHAINPGSASLRRGL